ncbi:MAG: FAD:protein FMN transferase [Rhodospirillaceae bacterium]|nr:FAD:protein FMN transferase [Rhodospirillaceae bacterium]
MIARARPLLGTLVSLSVDGVDETAAHAAIARGFAAIESIHRLMSFHEAASDVSRLNRDAHACWVTVAPATYRVLARAGEIAAATDGVFDITIAGRLVRWGFLPRPADAPAPQARATWRDIALAAPDRVRFGRPLWIDLGGIAKGYAVDAALAAMALPGTAQVVINAGGDVRVAGPAPERIVLRVPGHDAAQVPAVELMDGSIASSSGAEHARVHRGRQGRQVVGPHVHGRTRAPAGTRRFVSVLAPACIDADALTKVALVLGPRAAPTLRRFGATAYLHTARGGWRTLGAAP